MTSVTSRFTGVLVIVVLAAALLGAPGTAAAGGEPGTGAKPVKRTCGLLPGDGAYSFVRTTGIKCQTAIRIALRAQRRFCSFRNDCAFGFPPKVNRIYRGAVAYNGWQCTVRKGYELSEAACGKDGKVFVRKSGS